MRYGSALTVGFLIALAGIPDTAVPDVFAEDEAFYCEVLAVEGTAYLNNSEVYGKALQEGDLLKADDEIETADGSTVDLAFDREWANVTRVEEKSRLKVKAVFPTRLYLDKGALYAKLKSLPKDSTFQVETPTAIAAVRGTEYRTEYADGETSVSNDSEKDTSQVYLYEPNEEGKLSGEPTILPRTQFTAIPKGAKPRPPQPMNAVQKQHCEKARGVLDNKIRENVARGRVGKIQDLHKMEAFGQKLKERETARRENAQLRREENRAGGPNPPSGGAGTRGPGETGRHFDWSAEGAPRQGSRAEERAGGQDGEKANRYDNRDPGPRQDDSPPNDHFPGKDIRPAPIRGAFQGEGGAMRSMEGGYKNNSPAAAERMNQRREPQGGNEAIPGNRQGMNENRGMSNRPALQNGRPAQQNQKDAQGAPGGNNRPAARPGPRKGR